MNGDDKFGWAAARKERERRGRWREREEGKKRERVREKGPNQIGERKSDWMLFPYCPQKGHGFYNYDV